MMGQIFLKYYDLPDINNIEVMKYMGVRISDEKTEELTELCVTECLNSCVFTPRVCFTVFDLVSSGDIVELENLKMCSRSLSAHLKGCDKVILFAATIGIGIDRMVEKYSRLSASKALCFASIGTQRIETLCDCFCSDMQNVFSDMEHTSRFSPGYGDLEIAVQKDIFRILDCTKKIGVALCDSFIMSPSKSVTAFIGLCKRS